MDYQLRPVCIIGVLEFRYQSNSKFGGSEIVSEEILNYYGIKKYYKANLSTENNSTHINNIRYYLSAINTNFLKRDINRYGDIEMLYGIEVDCISVMNNCKEAIFEKELAEYNMYNFIKFMYDHYEIEYDSQTEIMALDLPEVSKYISSIGKNKKTDIVISPMDLHDVECTIDIKLVKVENIYSDNKQNSVIYTLSREINKEFCLYITKAGFKLNMNSITDPNQNTSVENCQLQFNIYACKKIKPWIHAMKRKIKKKFHIIEKFEYSLKELYKEEIEVLEFI